MRMKLQLFAACAFVVGFTMIGPVSQASAQSHLKRRPRKATICGNPTLPCKTTVPFEPNDLPFRVPANAVIIDTEFFYAVILKSLPTKEDDCDVFVSESERISAQSLFPDHKVFASRCADPGAPGSGMLYYTNVDPKFRIMAVYGGTTLAEAQRTLAAVKASAKFPGAYLKRMQTGFNGT